MARVVRDQPHTPARPPAKGPPCSVASDEPRELTPREQAGLAFAGQVLGSFLGGAPLRGAGL
ncbi:hypothetical protein [Streptomyces melanogenes]|uniref:hypothetical protein n=1 Tax=Streptomyces melanogenes TaxID=67326 RepID=UPI00167CBA72|nr:hypothetical protein [Streptomyces melanogenes]GGP32361.1 hypothetical protein GCM10010278_03230 [Streptomyces melanogenes]